MCILKVSCSVSLTGCVGLVGIFWRVGSGRAEPGRYVYFPLIMLAGLYRLFCLLGIVLAWMRVIEQVGGAGQYDFSSFPGFLVGPVRLKW